jgi:hypothetical protein
MGPQPPRRSSVAGKAVRTFFSDSIRSSLAAIFPATVGRSVAAVARSSMRNDRFSEEALDTSTEAV